MTDTERLRAALIRIDNLLSWPADDETLPATKALVAATLNPTPAPDPRPELTQRQCDFLDFIRSEIATKGYPPSVREIGARFGLSSPNGVMCHLKALEKKGYIRRNAFTSRTLAVVEAS